MVLHSVTPVAQAAAFTLGCVAIHNLRRYPNQVAGLLIVVIIMLFLTIVVKMTPASVLIDESNAEIGASIAPDLN